MERPPGLLGQLWDRFGPVYSPLVQPAIEAVAIEAGPEESTPAAEVDLYTSVRGCPPVGALASPSAPAMKREGPEFGSVEDLERS